MDLKEDKPVFPLLPMITNPVTTNNQLKAPDSNILNFKYQKGKSRYRERGDFHSKAEPIWNVMTGLTRNQEGWGTAICM